MLLYENKMGINQAWDSKVDYFSHLHHHIELVCLYDGATDATVDLKQYVLEKDSVLVAFPIRFIVTSNPIRTRAMS